METENTNAMTENVTTENQEDRQEYTPLHQSYCRECGTIISAKAATCPKCGAAQNQAAVKQDTASAGLMVLSYFFPIIGLILFCAYSQNTPNAAKQYGKWALIGFIVAIVSVIILYVSLFAAIGSLF